MGQLATDRAYAIISCSNKKSKMAIKPSRKNIALVITAAVLVTGAFYVKFGNLHPRKPQSQSPSQTQNQPAQTAQNAGPGDTSVPPAPTTQTTPPTSSKIAAPTGQLISNHEISLSSNQPESAPNEVSTCRTVPGAACDIRLTGPSGTIIMLGAKSTDAQGGAEFDWNARDKGLTPGKWKVEAVATKDGQSATSNPDYLQVNP